MAREDIRHDVGMRILLDVIVADGEALVNECLGDGVRHHFCGVPHRIVDNDGALLGLAQRPLIVEAYDLRDMGAPDNAMSRGNHLNVEFVDFLQRRLCLFGVEEKNVRVVFFCLIDDDRKIVVIVIALA